MLCGYLNCNYWYFSVIVPNNHNTYRDHDIVSLAHCVCSNNFNRKPHSICYDIKPS